MFLTHRYSYVNILRQRILFQMRNMRVVDRVELRLSFFVCLEIYMQPLIKNVC